MDPDHHARLEGEAGAGDEIVATAKRWVARRDAGLTVAERRELQSWIAHSARNAAAFSTADAARTELDWPLHAGMTDDVLARLDDRAGKRRRRRRVFTTASFAALLIVAVGWFGSGSPRERERPAPVSPTLAIWEAQHRILPDGSRVDLGVGAEISHAFDATTRVVTLDRGAAHFDVTKDGRPFIVKAGGVSARALGTVFLVEVNSSAVSVLVTQGRVAVDRDLNMPPRTEPRPGPASAQPLAVLSAGKAVSVAIGDGASPAIPSVVAMSDDEVRQKLSWRLPRLEFNGTPLVEVVAMVNRYNREQLLIADAALDRFAVSGVLRADKLDALVQMLEADFPIRVDHKGDTWILNKRN